VSRRERRRARFRDLPLLWKLLLPSLVLTMVLGAAGATVLVGYERRGATTTLDQKLFTRAVDADVFVRDETIALLESIRVAANLEGVPEAVAQHNRARASALLVGVPAVRDSVDLLVATDTTGNGLVEIRRAAGNLQNTSGGSWNRDFVAAAIAGTVDPSGDKQAGLIDDHGTPMLAVAAPLQTDRTVGAVIIGERLDRIAGKAKQRQLGASFAVYGENGDVLAATDVAHTRRHVAPVTGDRPRRVRERIAHTDRAVLYTPLTLRGRRAGLIATGVNTGPFYAPVRGAETRIVLLIVLAMAGIIGLGALLTRFVIRQMRPLLDTNRALGHGDLTARAEVYGNDELGEVARGLNQMAEQLQASYAELEMRVAARTEELQRVYDELAAALRNRTEVFAAISHEFRSPLFAIMGHADLMADPKFKPASRKWKAEFGDTISNAAQMLLRRVNDLLDIARIESGHVDLALDDVAIDDVIDDIRGTAAALARRGDLQFVVDAPRGLPRVRADRARLREIVLNLVSNAVKYTPPGGTITLSAATGVDEDGAVGLEVSVADTGVGIPDEIGERVFEPFYRVTGVEAHGGQPSTGLGLALVQRFVHAHGGAVWYRGRPGGGTVFTFRLPTGVSHPAVGASHQSRGEATGSDSGMLAVVVDREPSDNQAENDARQADGEHEVLQGMKLRP